MLSKNLENSTSYDIFFYKFWKKARVYYILSISRGGAGPRPPWIRHWLIVNTVVELCAIRDDMTECGVLSRADAV